jgi:hypothetical protein
MPDRLRADAAALGEHFQGAHGDYRLAAKSVGSWRRRGDGGSGEEEGLGIVGRGGHTHTIDSLECARTHALSSMTQGTWPCPVHGVDSEHVFPPHLHSAAIAQGSLAEFLKARRAASHSQLAPFRHLASVSKPGQVPKPQLLNLKP